jgi:RHS repeat-associated protein
MSSQNHAYAPDGSGPSISLTRTFSDFDGAGRPRTIQDERGLSTRQEYDSLGRPLKLVPPAGEVTTLSYPDEHTKVIVRGLASTTERTDGFGRLISRDLPDGSREEFSYDEFGREEARIVVSSDAAHERRNAAQSLYDALDRPTSRVSPGGALQGMTYSVDPGFPQYTLVTRTLNTPGTVSITKEYRDALGRVVRQESPNRDITEFTFDETGSLAKVLLTPAGGGTPQVREFKYDEGGRLIRRFEPETGTTLFEDFNGFGQPGTIKEAEGRVRTLAYDGLGRLLRMTGGRENLSYVYNGLDLEEASSQSDGVEVKQRFEYRGPAKQLSLEETIQPGLLSQIRYGYDAVSARMNAITYPNGRVVDYTRDGLGRITAISQNGSPVVSKISFDGWGNRSRVAFASGAYSDWKAKDFGLHLDQWNIGYVAGNGSVTALDGTRFFQYDSAERLTMAGDWDHLEHDLQGQLKVANSSSLALGTTPGFDAYGNNTSHALTGSGLGAVPAETLNPFAFNPMPDNRMPGMQANGVSPSGWVINGRGEATQVGMATGSTQSLGLTWDGLGRLRTVAYGGGVQSYLYAPSGMRVALMESASIGGSRRYAYTGEGLLLSEYAEAGAGGTSTLTAGLSATTGKEKTKIKTKRTKGGMAYMLPPGEEDPYPLPAGAWIVQPSGPTTAQVGQPVTFVGETDAGTTLSWTFGDGASVYTGTTSHAYAAPGTYTATFRASGVNLVASTASVTITVVAAGPRINSFMAAATTIPEGGGTDLSWDVSNATQVTITGLGTVPATGTARVTPTENSTYLLTASGSGNPVTAVVQITVVPAPVIQAFVSEPATIQSGQAAKLTWSVSHATSYSLDQGIGAVNGTWAMVWPGASRTFTLTATNQQNGISVTRTASTTVYVGAASNAAWMRDVIYLGTEAIAEIDAAGVHELHNDHLGSPTIITSRSSAQIEGRQVFGPFGERVKSEDYLPLTGYTGHVQRDATGLIYMRGRFYSPAWHRFVNSDQGVDPNSWNQMAYVGGSPFMATDPSGMFSAVCINGQAFDQDSGAWIGDGNGGILTCSGGGGAAIFNWPSGSLGSGSTGSDSGGISSSMWAFFMGWNAANTAGGHRDDIGSDSAQTPRTPNPKKDCLEAAQYQRQLAVNTVWNQFKSAKSQLKVNWNPGWNFNSWTGNGLSAVGGYAAFSEGAAWGSIPHGVALGGGAAATWTFAGVGAFAGGYAVGSYFSEVWENQKNAVFNLEMMRDSQIADANLQHQRDVRKCK